MKGLLLVESFDFCPSNQYILVRVNPSCFRFAKMCLCQVSLLSRCNPRCLTSSCSGNCTLLIWTGVARFSSCSECNVDRLGFVGFHSPFLNQFWIASRLVFSLCEAMAGSLSMASTPVSLAKVAVVDSGEVGRSAVYSRYNHGPRILPETGYTELSSVNYKYVRLMCYRCCKMWQHSFFYSSQCIVSIIFFLGHIVLMCCCCKMWQHGFSSCNIHV
jgi:hypothetical protein